MLQALSLVACLVTHQAPVPRDVTVKGPTRLDWAFAAAGFGKDAGALPADYDSTKQRYQLLVPKIVDKKKAAPLVLFISPSDQPGGLGVWQKVCAQENAFFASPYGAGNNTPAGQRIRIILDVLDDIRQKHRIDPNQTYVTGFSGGGRVACSVAFALPEYFGGAAPICGTNPLAGPGYLRHRIEDRLSVAFITGETDFNRKENEAFMAPWFAEIGVRSKLWIVPKLGHATPDAGVGAEVYKWLKDDVKRRVAEAKSRPKLAVLPDEAPSGAEQAQRMLGTAQAELKVEKTVWRGVALLQGVNQRWAKSPAGREATALLQKVANDEKLLPLIGEQGALDEQRSLSAQAKALEGFGQVDRALQAWEFLAKSYDGTDFGKKAAEQARRLKIK